MRSIAVYCGSSPGAKPEYTEAARALGEHLAKLGTTLVYGGGDIGLMGELANSVLTHSGSVVGVITDHLADKELAHDSLSKLHVVGSMHERKALMAELAEGFIALPGGIGSLEELCEVMVWPRLGLHSKPCGILNTAGYYDSLLQLFDNMVEQHFLDADQLHSLAVSDDPVELIEGLEKISVRYIDKWLDHSKENP